MDIAVFFDAPGFDDYPFTKKEYRKSYHDLGAAIEQRGEKFSIVRSQESYKGRSCFQGQWEYSGGTFRRKEGIFRFNRIYNKGHFTDDAGIDLINEPALDEICTNKWRTYQMFKTHCPRTELIEDPGRLSDAISHFAGGTRLVAKPRDGEEGRGIVIGTPEEIRHATLDFPLVLQEFLDTSAGIPGINVRTHDFRINIVNGNIILAFCRTPPPGGLLANVAQGGSIVPVPLVSIPIGALRVAEEVDAVLKRFSRRLYSIDMACLPDGSWRIIELNAKPALFGRERGEDFARFQDAIADLLTSP